MPDPAHGHWTLSIEPLPNSRPGLADEERLVRAFAWRVLLHASASDFGGVQVAVLVRREAVHAPLATLARTKRPPRVQKVSLIVVAEQLVRSLIRGPENSVLTHIDAVDVHRRPRAEIPLVEELAIFVEHLQASVVAIVHVHTARFGIHCDAVHAVEVS